LWENTRMGYYIVNPFPSDGDKYEGEYGEYKDGKGWNVTCYYKDGMIF
jgi:hypothetical protein